MVARESHKEAATSKKSNAKEEQQRNPLTREQEVTSSEQRATRNVRNREQA
jgi:hypothetical protein